MSLSSASARRRLRWSRCLSMRPDSVALHSLSATLCVCVCDCNHLIPLDFITLLLTTCKSIKMLMKKARGFYECVCRRIRGYHASSVPSPCPGLLSAPTAAAAQVVTQACLLQVLRGIPAGLSLSPQLLLLMSSLLSLGSAIYSPVNVMSTCSSSQITGGF